MQAKLSENRSSSFLRQCILIGALIIVLTASCSRPNPAEPTQTAQTEGSGKTLRVLNWDTYIAPSVLELFEEQMGVEIQYDIYGDPMEMYETIKQGEPAYDLVIATDFLVSQMRREGLFSAIDKTRVSNIRNIDESFITNVYDPGSRYCVPYLWGTVGIGYNSEASGAVDSWGDLFRDANINKIALLDDTRTQLGVILLYLGYSPNTSDPLELEALEEFLEVQMWKAAAIAADEGQDLLADGSVNLAIEYNGDILQLAQENPAFQYVIPKEGTVIWVDSMCIPAGSQNQELAEQFMNFMLEPENAAAVANYTRYATPNQAALPLVNEADRNNPNLYPPEEVRSRLFYLADLGTQTSETYQKIWDHLKGISGK